MARTGSKAPRRIGKSMTAPDNQPAGGASLPPRRGSRDVDGANSAGKRGTPGAGSLRRDLWEAAFGLAFWGGYGWIVLAYLGVV